jgi:hypothetical protein
VETQILGMTRRYPTYNYLHISDQLKLAGAEVSPSMARAFWQRYGITLRIHRGCGWNRNRGAKRYSHRVKNRLVQKHRGRTADPERPWKLSIQAACDARAPLHRP